MLRRVLIALLLAVSAYAGEPTPEDRAIRAGAEELVRAYREGRLEEVAATDAIRALDRWLLLDALLVRGEFDLAFGFVEALDSADREELEEYAANESNLTTIAALLVEDLPAEVQGTLRGMAARDEIDPWRIASRARTVPKADLRRLLPVFPEPEQEAFRHYVTFVSELPIAAGTRRSLRRARVLIESGRIDEAAIALPDPPPQADPVILSRIAFAAGELAVARDDVEAALAAFERAALHAGGDESKTLWLRQVVAAREWQGQIAYEALEFDRAVSAFAATADANGARGRTLERCRALQNVAAASIRSGRSDGATEALREALEVARVFGHGEEIGDIHLAMGHAALVRSRHAAARRAYLKAVDVCKGDEAQAWHARIYVGVVCDQLGETDRARRLLEGAASYFAEHDIPAEQCLALGSLANLCWRIKAWDEAHENLSQAVRLAERVGDEATRASLLTNWALVQEERGEIEAARRLHVSALAAARAVRNPQAECGALANAGNFERRHGSGEKAALLLERALRLADLLDVRTQRTDALHGLAMVRLSQGQRDVALAHWRDAITGMPAVFQHLDPSGGARARENWSRLFARARTTAVSTGRPDTAYWFIEVARAGSLREAIDGRQELMRATLPAALHEDVARAQEQVSAARQAYTAAKTRNLRREATKARRRLDRAQAKLEEALGRIRSERKLAAELIYPEPTPIGRVCDALHEDEALVLYSFDGDRAAAVVLRPSGPLLVDLGDGGSIEALGSRLAEAARKGDRDEWKPTADELRSRIIAPLGLGPDVRNLLIAPAGSLHAVPFSLLTPGVQPWFVPSATVFEAIRAGDAPAGGRVFAVADPERDLAEGWGPLNHSRDAVRSFADETAIGKAATEERFIEAVSESGPWRAVHLSCHSEPGGGDPLASRLILASPKTEDALDGDLTAADVYGLTLKTDLVVLAACETGKGVVVEMEGQLGLPRAFLVAGAPRVLASLWKVDDAATAHLMTRFYEGFHPREKNAPPLRVGAALTEAVRKTSKNERYESPRDWAAWVLWGVPD